MPKRIIIVGGVAAGTSAAARARRCDESADITIFEKGEHISYAGCGLPYYISGVIEEREDLLVQTPEAFERRHNVAVRTCHEVTSIGPAQKQVAVRDLRTGAHTAHAYDSLILALGARPVVPPIPGVDLGRIFTLRSISDADRIHDLVDQEHPRRAVIVGGGLIGLEMAEGLLRKGVSVTVAEQLNQILSPLDWEMAEIVRTHLEGQGVQVIISDGVARFEGQDGIVSRVITASRQALDVDLVILCIGIRPNVDLAKKAGVEIGKTGAIAVNEFMETSIPGIYAAGDCAETRSLVTGEPVWLPLGSVANKQGRTAGENAVGGRARFRGALGTAIAKVCDLAAARTGLTEREARERGMDVVTAYIHPDAHAHYYPGAEPLHIKLIADQASGRLLGAQAVGAQGVDKRIDVFATAIHNGMTAQGLFDLDLAYAPPFSSAKDPVIVAGLVAEGCRTGICLSAGELKRMKDSARNLDLIDVRDPDEYAQGHLPGARNLPLSDLRSRLDEIDRTRDVVVYCKVGLRGYLASRILRNHAFPSVFNLSGGLLSWPYEVEKG